MKEHGPLMDPCGTPDSIGKGSEAALLTNTIWVVLVK